MPSELSGGQRWRVAIQSRGYGANGGQNDEAMVLEENLPDVPHLQGADRSAIADAAVEELEAELLVLDDGFQHRRLHRDLDVVLIDATHPPMCDYLFPRGTLRESLPRDSLVKVARRCPSIWKAQTHRDLGFSFQRHKSPRKQRFSWSKNGQG